jgi:hypothetical protein
MAYIGGGSSTSSCWFWLVDLSSARRRIYVLGGASKGVWTGATCYYDTTRDTWHHLPNMPTARRRTDAVFWRHPKTLALPAPVEHQEVEPDA